jgi:hypothetical protein
MTRQRQLTAEAEAERDDFERAYGLGGNCACHISPPCGSCSHPGNPRNQAEDETAWEPVPSTERPMLFTAPLVRAILDGRKTQTRRIFKLPSWAEWDTGPGRGEATGDILPKDPANRGWYHIEELVCPYGSVGDRLWVRETCRAHELNSGLDGVLYPADDKFIPIDDTQESVDRWIVLNSYRDKKGATVPAIHMPRWASRITLEITDVRTQRLQDISEADAEAEGVDFLRRVPDADETLDARGLFRCLWDGIYEARGLGWDANPWVHAISFRRVEGSDA